MEEYFGTAEQLLELLPEELAPRMLAYIKNWQINGGKENFARYNLFGPEILLRNGYNGQQINKIALALSEGWNWLVNQGLIIEWPAEAHSAFYTLSRRANEIESDEDFRVLTYSKYLAKDALDRRLVGVVWGNFVRGEFDTAVFNAFKEVEVRIREVGGYDNALIGVPLATKAFHPDTGALTDMTLEAGERTAQMQLFAGSIGSFKNPSSHRVVEFDEPLIVVGMIYHANNLLKIVESRRKTGSRE